MVASEFDSEFIYQQDVLKESFIDRGQDLLIDKLSLASNEFSTTKETARFNQHLTSNYGFCNGLTILWLISKRQQFAASDKQYKYTNTWFNDMITDIVTWDGKRELTPQKIADFEKFSLIIDCFQYLYLLDFAQNDVKQGILLQELDFPGRNLEKKYTLASKFTSP